MEGIDYIGEATSQLCRLQVGLVKAIDSAPPNDEAELLMRRKKISRRKKNTQQGHGNVIFWSTFGLIAYR